jgi:hypothetical protein
MDRHLYDMITPAVECVKWNPESSIPSEYVRFCPCSRDFSLHQRRVHKIVKNQTGPIVHTFNLQPGYTQYMRALEVASLWGLEPAH